MSSEKCKARVGGAPVLNEFAVEVLPQANQLIAYFLQPIVEFSPHAADLVADLPQQGRREN